MQCTCTLANIQVSTLQVQIHCTTMYTCIVHTHCIQYVHVQFVHIHVRKHVHVYMYMYMYSIVIMPILISHRGSIDDYYRRDVFEGLTHFARGALALPVASVLQQKYVEATVAIQCLGVV